LSFGLFRISLNLTLRSCDCEISEEMIKVRIVTSKTDQLRQGNELLVARTRSRTCPVAMLERYMAMTGISWSDQAFFFRPIQRTKNGESLKDSGKISHPCLWDLFNKKLSKLGFPSCDFSPHSLRAGGLP